MSVKDKLEAGIRKAKDKLEIGLKPDAPYRKDNLPEFQQENPACEDASAEGTSPEVQRAREECDETTPAAAKGATDRPKATGPRPKQKKLAGR